jgi:hypothetical protein
LADALEIEVHQVDGVDPVRIHQLWSCGIVVASTSIPETLVFGGLAARPIGAAVP